MPTRAWISPKGEVLDVADEELWKFCATRGLHYCNMLEHIHDAGSDHKNNGWRLIERLRFIGHVDHPHAHVPALGTLDAFHQSCLSATDGRSVLRDKTTLGKLLAGTYNGGGKAWKKWELRHLSTAQKRHALQQRLDRGPIVTQPMAMAPPTHGQQPTMMPILPDYVRASAHLNPRALPRAILFSFPVLTAPRVLCRAASRLAICSLTSLNALTISRPLLSTSACRVLPPRRHPSCRHLLRRHPSPPVRDGRRR